MTARTDTNEDDMSSAAGTRRKTKLSQYRTSALHALRATGLIGLFAGSPDLASSRKRLLKEKLRGKRILTADRSDFEIYRTKAGRRLEILP